jgi:hypothetical protein
MSAVAGWLTVGRNGQLCSGDDLGKFRKLRHGSGGVHECIESMRRYKPGKRRLRTTTCGGRCEHKPSNDADQDRNGQP